ncbi:hypothetical protein ACH5RR_003458 [Cinchona calisaya]|uniref:Uncharacterized protein n=1 Tax=Cinchona calisaya TaxID=153742 RepID=A0ABD3AUT5_9GENT
MAINNDAGNKAIFDSFQEKVIMRDVRNDKKPNVWNIKGLTLIGKLAPRAEQVCRLLAWELYPGVVKELWFRLHQGYVLIIWGPRVRSSKFEKKLEPQLVEFIQSNLKFGDLTLRQLRASVQVTNLRSKDQECRILRRATTRGLLVWGFKPQEI